jgi:hypothetical protein
MQKRYFILLVILFQNVASFAQPAIEWQKCFGGTGEDEPELFHSYKDILQQTTDKGFIIGVTSTSNDGNVTGHHGSATSEDYWIVKTDSLGNIQWQKSLGGDQPDIANSVQQTNDGGYIVGGFTWSNNGDVTGNRGNTDYWIVKLDNSGKVQWEKCYGGSSYDQAYSIKQTTDGGYIVAGRTSSYDVTPLPNGHGSDYWILKLNSSGNIQWQKCFGGTLDEEAHSIELTNDGGYIVVGQAGSNDGNVSGNHTQKGKNLDYWVVKLNSNGDLMWQKCYGGTNNDLPSSISRTNDGGYIIAGQTSSDDGDVKGYLAKYSEGWIIKIDSVGNLQWQKCLGGNASTAIQTLDGGFLIGGNLAANDSDAILFPNIEYYWMIKLDNNHNFQWHTCDGNKNGGYSNAAIQTFDGKYVVLGRVNKNFGDVNGAHGGQDVWLVKFSDLNFIKSYEREICSQCNGNASIKVTGGTPPYSYKWSNGNTTNKITNLCHSTYTVSVTDSKNRKGFGSIIIINDILQVRMTQSSASCWTCPDGSATLHPSGGSGVYYYSWPGFPDTTPTLIGLPRGSAYGCVTDSMGCIVCDSIEVTSSAGLYDIVTNDKNIHIFPNPTSSIINLQFPKEFGQPKVVEVFSSIGKSLMTSRNISSLDLSNLKNGIYFIFVTNDKGEKLKTIAIKI